MAGIFNTIVDAGAVFTTAFWIPTALNTYYNFSPGGDAGTPLLTAKDANGNIVLSLTSLPNPNGDYLGLGVGVFTSSDGVYTIPQGYWLQLFISGTTTSAFAGQVLDYQVDFFPNGQLFPIRIISAGSELQFTGNEAADCPCGLFPDLTDDFNAKLLAAGYSIPIEDDWRGSVTPPASPAIGIQYIVPRAATGVWLGKDGMVATWTGAAWVFSLYQSGTTAFIRDRDSRSQLVDFNHPTFAINGNFKTSSATCVGWVPDFVLDQLQNDYAGIVQGTTNSAPPTPNPYDKWIVGTASTWPGFVSGAAGTLALAIIDQSTNSVQWVYSL